MRDSNGPGEIYLVQTPHCMHLHVRVFKTGRAHDAGDRLKGYPKGTKLLCCLPVSHMRDAEGAMLGSCRSDAEVVERRDFGSEYFEADLGHLINKLLAVASLFTWTFHETHAHRHTQQEGSCEDEDDSPHRAAAVDATLLLGDYVRANIGELSRTPVDSAQLLNDVVKMLSEAGCRRGATPTLKALIQDLQKYFGAEEIMSHRFPDGMHHAIRFRKPVADLHLPPRSSSSRSARFFQSFTMK